VFWPMTTSNRPFLLSLPTFRAFKNKNPNLNLNLSPAPMCNFAVNKLLYLILLVVAGYSLAAPPHCDYRPQDGKDQEMKKKNFFLLFFFAPRLRPATIMSSADIVRFVLAIDSFATFLL
jgi:hypothetical protein